ncbi:pentatricopeptide repeat-containing protein [Iris pallida]|uniref:Pentatricopeptide repeat-containing protein n=1 Tax=Iris pallida TaxID=29817 RepID=A0AAX6GS22_IRIPA|nr:pentatricopeptide repeat-containing protein [Iris pallida]
MLLDKYFLNHFRRERVYMDKQGGMVAVRIEAIYGCSSSLFGPYMLPQIQLDDPVEKYMTAFEEACPLPANLSLKKVAIRFLKDSVVPIIDDWGSCVGIVHSDDCNERSGGTERGGGGGYSMAGTGTGTFYRGGAGSGRDRHNRLYTQGTQCFVPKATQDDLIN